MEDQMENEGKILPKNSYWLPDIKLVKRQQLENDLYIKNKVDKEENIALYLPHSKAIELNKKILSLYTQWCSDYESGKTCEMPSTSKIARFCKVLNIRVRKVVTSHYKQYIKYNTISAQEYKDIYKEEFIDV